MYFSVNMCRILCRFRIMFGHQMWMYLNKHEKTLFNKVSFANIS